MVGSGLVVLGDEDAAGKGLEMRPVAELAPGMIIELTGRHKLWDFSVIPWRELPVGTRLRVLKVAPLATGRTDRQPYDLVLVTSEDTRVRLEVDSGEELVAVVADGP